MCESCRKAVEAVNRKEGCHVARMAGKDKYYFNRYHSQDLDWVCCGASNGYKQGEEGTVSNTCIKHWRNRSHVLHGHWKTISLPILFGGC